MAPPAPSRPHAAMACLALMLAASGSAQAQTRSFSAELAVSSDLTERGAFVGQRRPLVQAAASMYDASGWTLGGALGVPSSGLGDTRLVLRGAFDRPLKNDWQGQAQGGLRRSR